MSRTPFRFSFLLALLASPLGGCRLDPVAIVTDDAREFFACDEVDVQYAGSYDTLGPGAAVELYEVYAECGGAATYRCEIFDEGVSSSTSCCRFGDPSCDEFAR